MLLAGLPFIAATYLYWMSCADLFRGPLGSIPGNWTAKLFLPILTGTLTSLTAAAHADHVPLLLTVAGVGVVFSIMVAAGLRNETAFVDLRLPVTTRRRSASRLRRWHLLRLVGVVVMVYGGIATMIGVS